MSLIGTIRDLGYIPRAHRIPGALPCVATECDSPRGATRLVGERAAYAALARAT